MSPEDKKETEEMIRKIVQEETEKVKEACNQYTTTATMFVNNNLHKLAVTISEHKHPFSWLGIS